MSELILDLRAETTELTAIEAESIGWLPLGDGAYLHVGDPEGEVITTSLGFEVLERDSNTGITVLALTLASGFGLSALDGSRRVDILAVPFVGLVLWNLAVYALAAASRMRRRPQADGQGGDASGWRPGFRRIAVDLRLLVGRRVHAADHRGIRRPRLGRTTPTTTSTPMRPARRGRARIGVGVDASM